MPAADSGWVRAHSDDEDDWRRWEESPIQQIDFAVHIHYLQTYLQGRERVLEVGAGAGRFTRELAALTQPVVVVDISAEKLRRNRRHAQALGYADRIEQWCECDMCDLKPYFEDDTFDAVVCYGGPLSYVFDRREHAISELVRVTRSGGLLFLSARSLWGTLHEHLPHILQFDPQLNREIIATGNMGPSQVAAASRFWHAYRADEFKAFIESAGASVLALSASNCLSSTWSEVLLAWRSDETRWKHLIELEIEACRQPGCLDMGTHILAVARKKG